MRVAVIVSGSLRTFNSVWPHNEKVLTSLKIDYDIYLHTWAENFGTHRSVAKGKSPRRLFWRWLPTKFEELKSFDPQHYINPKIYTNIVIEELPDFDELLTGYKEIVKSKNGLRFRNSCAMYLGIEKASQMALTSKINYSHFLRLRTDFQLNQKFKLEDNIYLTMCGDGVFINRHHISDQCFYARFEHINPVMFNFSFLKKCTDAFGWYSSEYGRHRKAEFILFENLASHNLLGLTRSVNRRSFGKIVRENEVRDYDKRLLNYYKELLHHNITVIYKISKLTLANFRRIYFKTDVRKLFKK